RRSRRSSAERSRARRSATRSSTTTSTTPAPSKRSSTARSRATSASGTSNAGRHSWGVSKRPLIGITSYAQRAKWGAWDLPAALIPLDYVDSVERAGGRPLIVPPSEDGVEEALDVLHGVVFSGGADIGPAHYGADAHPETDQPQLRRDAGELALLRAALD